MEKKDYKRILDLPAPKSKNHRPMMRQNRAAQFAPFAALTGHQEAIEEEARYVEKKRKLSQEAREELDRKISLLLGEEKRQEEVKVIYFLHDHKKKGGIYKSIWTPIEEINKEYIMTKEGEKIALEDIWDISLP